MSLFHSYFRYYAAPTTTLNVPEYGNIRLQDEEPNTAHQASSLTSGYIDMQDGIEENCELENENHYIEID